MTRKNLAEILKNAKIDLSKEYGRLYEVFYETSDRFGNTIFSASQKSFLQMPFRRTYISLDDFNSCCGFNFVAQPQEFELNYLVEFCEYSYNLVIWSRDVDEKLKQFYRQQLYMVLEIIGYEFVYNKEMQVNILVPKNQEAIAVAEIVDDKMAFSVLEYNHHALKGHLMKKKTILKYMADDIEPQRKKLNDINRTLSDQLFQMFQKFVRHNNEENTYIKSLTENEIEDIYDDIYQMWLLAKLELDNISRKRRFAAILGKVNA